MRVTVVAKAQKAQGTCGQCGKPITKGESYRWWKPRFGGKRVRCMAPACAPKGSDLTSNDVTAAGRAAAEGAESAISDAVSVEEINDAIRECAETVETDCVEALQEKMDNIEQGFGHTDVPAYQELDDRRSEYESWKDELDGFDGERIELEVEIKDAEGEPVMVTLDCDTDPFDDEAAAAAVKEALGENPDATLVEQGVAVLREAFDEALEDQRNEARNVLNCPE